jgi:UDP-N-acetylmuramate--alanine ligase
VKLDRFENIYFVGIGGIGMSALARYFHQTGKRVLGYDRVLSPLCIQLQQEGMMIHIEDLGEDVEKLGLTPENTLVVITPAIPINHGEKIYFEKQGFVIQKRAQVLGLLTENMKGLTVAGTHGKTTTSTLLAHVLKGTSKKSSAFLGGISSNYNTNLLIDKESDWVVVEADEFDRSFLYLNPFAAIITSTDADHLDIYKNKEDFLSAFQQFTELVIHEGFVIRQVDAEVTSRVKSFSYAIDKPADYRANNLRVEQGYFVMDVVTPHKNMLHVELGLPGIHNAENALSVIALLEQLNVGEYYIRSGLRTFKGVKRRFEYHIRRDNLVYIDDYAHHPSEINQLIKSVRMMYPGKKITAIFQPHLFSRTHDFMDEFALELSKFDETFLLPIYPAREEPIKGVTSSVLAGKMSNNVKLMDSVQDVLEAINENELDVVLTIGAGDIDRIIEPLKLKLS